MKKILLLVVAALSVSIASAQSFDVGSKNLTLSVGFWGGGTPVAISYEQGIYEFAADHQLGLGGYLGLYNSIVAPAVECNYHFVGVEKLDLYAGYRLGLSIYDGGSKKFNQFSIGANYDLDSKWALNVEFGSGVGSVGLGVVYKL